MLNRFTEQWNFHHSLGALDGKHIRMRCPPKSGTSYFNYKKYYSIILLALVDADYRFVYVEVGAEGSAGDAGIWNQCELMQAIDQNRAHIPPRACLPNDDQPMPYFIIGDNAFAMKTWLMKPFAHTDQVTPERLFNYRLSRARRCVECAFGILANR